MKLARILMLTMFVLLGLACELQRRDDGIRSQADDARIAGEIEGAPARRMDARRTAAPDRPRVLVVSIDGLRPDAISRERTPVLQTLIDGGSYHPRGQAELPPSTLPNHASMLTGLCVVRHGVLFNSDRDGRIDKRTIIDAARAAGLRAGFFASKTKFRYLCNNGQADAWAIETDVDRVTDAVIPALSSAGLDLVFLHYGEPDGAGHKHGWMTDKYFAEVSRVDAAFGRVLAAMEAAGYREHTLVIVTADHGGHGKSHGLPIADDVNVPFILHGPGIAAGRALEGGAFAMSRAPRPMDAAANALAALGVSIDGDDLFADGDASAGEWALSGLGGANGIDGVVTLEARVDYVPPEMASPLVFGLPCGPLPPMMLLAVPFALQAIRRRNTEPRVLHAVE